MVTKTEVINESLFNLKSWRISLKYTKKHLLYELIYIFVARFINKLLLVRLYSLVKMSLF